MPPVKLQMTVTGVGALFVKRYFFPMKPVRHDFPDFPALVDVERVMRQMTVEIVDAVVKPSYIHWEVCFEVELDPTANLVARTPVFYPFHLYYEKRTAGHSLRSCNLNFSN